MPGPNSSLVPGDSDSSHYDSLEPWREFDFQFFSPPAPADPVQQTMVLCVLLVLLALLFLFSLTVNISLLLVFFKKPSLRTYPNRFVMNLLAVNVVSCVLLLPLVALDQLDLTVHHAQQCLLSQAVNQGVASLSLLSVCILGLDQYLAVLQPLRYHHHMTRSLSSLLITAVWTLSGLAGGTTALLPSTSPLWNCCLYQPPASTSSLILSLVLLLSTFLLPVLTLAVIYCIIFFEAHNCSERTLHQYKYIVKPKMKKPLYKGISKEAGFQEIRSHLKDSEVFLNRSSPGLRLALSESFRHRLSSASQLYHREESHTACLFLTSLSLVLICWAPLYTVSSLYTLPTALPPLPAYIPPTVLLLCLSYSLLSPFLFAYRHRKIRAEVWRLYSLHPPHTPLSSLPPLPPGRRSHRAKLRGVLEGRALLRTLSTETSSQSSCSSSVSQCSSQD